MIKTTIRDRGFRTILMYIIVLITLISLLCACSNGNLQHDHQESSQQHNDSFTGEESASPVEEENDPPVNEENENTIQEEQYYDGLSAEDGKIHVFLVGEGEKIFTPKSSFIVYLDYYKESEHLIVCINNKKNNEGDDESNGKEYVYANISESLWKDFKKAESKGNFYNAEIKDHAQYFINDYNGKNGDLIIVHHVDN